MGDIVQMRVDPSTVDLGRFGQSRALTERGGAAMDAMTQQQPDPSSTAPRGSKQAMLEAARSALAAAEQGAGGAFPQAPRPIAEAAAPARGRDLVYEDGQPVLEGDVARSPDSRVCIVEGLSFSGGVRLRTPPQGTAEVTPNELSRYALLRRR